jgi:hypothetical protein
LLEAFTAAQTSGDRADEFRIGLQRLMAIDPVGIWTVICLFHSEIEFGDFGDIPYESMQSLMTVFLSDNRPFGPCKLIFKFLKLPTIHYVNFFAREEAIAALISRRAKCHLVVGCLGLIAHRQPLARPILAAHGLTLLMTDAELSDRLGGNADLALLLSSLVDFDLDLEDPLWEFWCTLFPTQEKAAQYLLRSALRVVNSGERSPRRVLGQVRMIQFSVSLLGSFEPLIGSGFIEWSIQFLGELAPESTAILRVLTLELDVSPLLGIPPLIEAVLHVAANQTNFSARCLAFQFVLRAWIGCDGDPSICELVSSDEFVSLIPLFGACVPMDYRVVILHMLSWWKSRIPGLEFSDELLAFLSDFAEDADGEARELAASLFD